MQISSLITAFFIASASAIPTESAAELHARAEFKVLLCTNYKDANPRNIEPCITFTVDPGVVNNGGIKVQAGIKQDLCNKLATFPGGGCPSSARILQQGRCTFGTSNGISGGTGTTQIISDRDGLTNFNGNLNDNFDCVICSTGIAQS